MAQAIDSSGGPTSGESGASVLECAVCLQSCIHPAQLPCSHVFCFLCVKGVANQSKRCPMCRQEIPPDFIERPQLVELDHNGGGGGGQAAQKKDSETAGDGDPSSSSEEYQWFYEGRNGWWQYDQRTSLELETAYKQGKRSCELLIAGFLYVADFSSMFQTRRNDHSRKRRIKRDLYNAPKKGVAGLRLNQSQSDRDQDEQQQPQSQQQQQQPIVREIRGAERSSSPTAGDNIVDGSSTPIPPSNTPQTPAGSTRSGDATPSTERSAASQRSDSLHQVLEQMRSLILRGNLSSSSNNQQDQLDQDQSTLIPWILHHASSDDDDDEEEEEDNS